MWGAIITCTGGVGAIIICTGDMGCYNYLTGGLLGVWGAIITCTGNLLGWGGGAIIYLHRGSLEGVGCYNLPAQRVS